MENPLATETALAEDSEDEMAFDPVSEIIIITEIYTIYIARYKYVYNKEKCIQIYACTCLSI